jgi:putative tricarboxylic transport membrane protein
MKNNVWDMILMTLFGIVGYLMRKFKFDAPPLLLAFILGPIMEASLRRSLLIAGGNPLIFVQRPISGVIILCVVLMMVSTLIPSLRKKKKTIEKIVSEGGD